MVVYSVYRWTVPFSGQIKFMLVLSTKIISDREKEFTGIVMEKDGIGCKKEDDSIAYPNTKGIERLIFVGDVVTKRVENAKEVLVVTTSVIRASWFLAVPDMSLRLYMIDDMDTKGFNDSFAVVHTSSPDDWLIANGYLDRVKLLQHYEQLLEGLFAFRDKLRCGTEDSGNVNIHIKMDERMASHLSEFITRHGLDSIKTSRTSTEYKLDGKEWKAIKVHKPADQIISFHVLSFVEQLFGPSALWAPRDIGCPFEGDMLKDGGVTYRLFVQTNSCGKLTYSLGGHAIFNLSMESRKMQGSVMFNDVPNPFNVPSTVLDPKHDTLVTLENGEEISIPPYYLDPQLGICQCIHVKEVPTAVSKEEQRAKYVMNQENQPANNQRFRQKKQLAAVSIVIEVENIFHVGKLHDRDPRHIVDFAGANQINLFHGLVELRGNELVPRPQRGRQLLYKYSATGEPPLVRSPMAWVEGLLLLEPWYDETSFIQRLQILFESYNIKSDALQDMITYYKLPDTCDLSPDGVANALLKQLCDMFTNWNYYQFSVRIR